MGGVELAGVAVTVVPWDDPDVTRLREEQQAELKVLYDGEADLEPHLPPEEMLATVAVSIDGEVVACGSLRDATRYGEGYGELKRMYVLPRVRGRGLARRVLVALEGIAAENDLRRLILETGRRQVAAITLYRSAGYRRIAPFGPYDERDISVCYARWLVPDAGARVLVVNGTVGAGKTAVAEHVGEVLRERAVPHAVLDVDALRWVWPPPEGDRFAQRVVFEHLAAIAPNLAARGYRHVVLAEVVEDPEDRERYELAFDGADVRIVRVVASHASRNARIVAREADAESRDWHLARTVELEAVLEAAGVDDAVVPNDRPLAEVAAQVLRAAGW